MGYSPEYLEWLKTRVLSTAELRAVYDEHLRAQEATMPDSLFDVNDIPLAKRPRRTRPLADQLAAKAYPIWAIHVGTVTEYVRALDEQHALGRWHDRHPSLHDYDAKVKIRRMLHADLARLAEIDPKLAGKLRNI